MNLQLNTNDSLNCQPDSNAVELPWTFKSDFLTPEAADQWLHSSQEVNWQQNNIKMFGKKIALPRLEAVIGEGTYSYSGVTLKTAPWSESFRNLKELVEKESGYQFQIVMGNQYRDGNDHVGWHSDDEKMMGRRPEIASLSLGAIRKFQLRHKVTKEIYTFQLTHGSLLVMQPGCQKEWQHRICKEPKIQGLRVNWTFRPLVLG